MERNDNLDFITVASQAIGLVVNTGQDIKASAVAANKYLSGGWGSLSEDQKRSALFPAAIYLRAKEVGINNLTTNQKTWYNIYIQPLIVAGVSDKDIRDNILAIPVNDSTSLANAGKTKKAKKLSDEGKYNSLSSFQKSLIPLPLYAVKLTSALTPNQANINPIPVSTKSLTSPKATNNIFDQITDFLYNQIY